MKKIFLTLFCIIVSFIHVSAQNETVTKTISVFPYQHPAEAGSAFVSMYAWNKAHWKNFLSLLDDDSLKVKAAYALSAYINHVTANAEKKKEAAAYLSKELLSVKTWYGRDLVIQHLGLLGDDAGVKILSKLLSDEIYVGNAARALAVIRSAKSIAALNKALSKAKEPAAKHIQAALDNVNKPLPEIKR